MSDSDNGTGPPQILVFDSGVGGLSVLSEIKKRVPQAKLIFACDNAAFPYGTHTESGLMKRVLKVLGSLIRKIQPDLVVVACNTASTLVLDELRRQFDIPFVGVVPAIKPAAALSNTRVIGLLATPATIERNYTDGLIADFAPNCEVLRIGSSEMVYMAEQKLRGSVPDMALLEDVLKPFSEREELDAVVLACTHFPLLLDELMPLLPRKVQWVDSGAAIARRVESLLPKINATAEAQPPETSHRALMTSDDKHLENLSIRAPAFELRPFEIFSL